MHCLHRLVPMTFNITAAGSCMNMHKVQDSCSFVMVGQ
jgi:hypothetical protein